jgi:hypothetical protein
VYIAVSITAVVACFIYEVVVCFFFVLLIYLNVINMTNIYNKIYIYDK